METSSLRKVITQSQYNVQFVRGIIFIPDKLPANIPISNPNLQEIVIKRHLFLGRAFYTIPGTRLKRDTRFSYIQAKEFPEYP